MGAIVPHACHDYPNASGAEFLRNTFEQYIGRRPVTVYPGFITQDRNIPQGQPLYFQMLAAGADKDASPVQHITRLRFLHAERAAFVEPACKHLREPLGHMLHDYDATRKISRQLRQHVLQRLRPPRRNTDGDNPGRLAIRNRLRFQTFYWLRKCAGDLNAAALGGGLDLCDQLLAAFLHTRRHVGRLGDKIKSSQRQRLQSDRGALRAVRTHHDDRQAMASHDFPQHIETTHTGHFQVEGNDLGFELLDLLQSEVTVHCGSDYFNSTVSRENLRNQLSHERRVIDHQDPYRLRAHCHTSAEWPSCRARENNPAWLRLVPPLTKRSITAAKFIINTTRPSPRIEALLTRSDATV